MFRFPSNFKVILSMLKITKNTVTAPLKGHSQLMHMRITYHFMSKRTLKNRFFSKRLKMKQNTAKNEVDFNMNFG